MKNILNIANHLKRENELRTKRAVIVMTLLYGEDEEGPRSQRLAALICDLAHLCDRGGEQLSEALKRAWESYHGETDGQGRQFSAAARKRESCQVN